MAKKKRANEKYKQGVPIDAERDLPEHQDRRNREKNQVTANLQTQILPISKRNNDGVMARAVGSVDVDLPMHQNSSLFQDSHGVEVSNSQFNLSRDHHYSSSSRNIVINVNGPANDESVEIHQHDSDVSQTRQQYKSRSSEQYDGARNVLPSRENLEPRSPAVAQNPVSPTPSRATVHPPPPPLTVQKSSEIYYRHLLAAGRGSPLWIPEPSSTLSLEYQRAGIGIGDVIILSDSGGTDFLFNIHHPKGDSNHPINPPVMPEGYCPLARPHGMDMSSYEEFKNDDFLASSSVNSQRDEEFSGLIFESSAMDGAILTMPNGANSTDLHNKTMFRRYARDNAEQWYKYANEVRGRDAGNGDIRLVIGKTSTTTWGMATFAGCSEESTFRLKFKPTGNSENSTTYKWEYSGMARAKSGPDTHEIEKLRAADADVEGQLAVYENQCLFVRTINVTLQDGVWDKLMIEWKRLGLVEDGASSGSNSDPGLGTGGSHLSSSESGSKSASGPSGMSSAGNQMGTQAQAGMDGKPCGNSMSLTDSVVPPPASQCKRSVYLSAFPPPLDLHPSKIINQFLLRERPQAKIAITEDEDWMSVLDQNDKVFPAPNILISRIMDMYVISGEADMVFLKSRDSQSVSLRSCSPTSTGMSISASDSIEIRSEGREDNQDQGQEEFANILKMRLGLEPQHSYNRNPNKTLSELSLSMAHCPNVIIFGEKSSSVIKMLSGIDIDCSGTSGICRHPDHKNSNGKSVYLYCRSRSQVVHIDEQPFRLHKATAFDFDSGAVASTLDIVHAYDLIHELDLGVSLLVFCMQGTHITEGAKRNWNLFYEIFCQRGVPIVALVTGERNRVLTGGKFVIQNHPTRSDGPRFHEYDMFPKDVAYTTVINREQDLYPTSRHISQQELNAISSKQISQQELDASVTKIRQLIKSSYLKDPWKMGKMEWLNYYVAEIVDVRILGRKITQYEVKKKKQGIVHDLVKRCGMEKEDALKLAQMLQSIS